MSTPRFSIAKYTGYDPVKKCFVFMQDNGIRHTVVGTELSWMTEKALSNLEIMQIMNNRIGRKFRIMEYHLNYGFYIEAVTDNIGERSYHLFNATTDEFTGITYPNLAFIPWEYESKPVYKYRKKVVLHEIKQP